jgi:hypothetical protein
MRLAAIALALVMFVIPASAQDKPKDLKTKVNDSVGLLYTQDVEGGMHFTCTATAYKQIDGGYRFVSASHCVEGEANDEQQQIKFFITADKSTEKKFIAANLVLAGNKTDGDDFSIFEVKTTDKFEVTPLGDETKLQPGDRVIDISSPLGLGKQYFEGYVSAPKLDRPAIDAGDTKWNNAMLVEIGGGPGSSGSAIVSTDQAAIVGFLVGSFSDGEVGFICVPVSKFKTFEAKVDAKTYKKKEKKNFLFSLFGG